MNVHNPVPTFHLYGEPHRSAADNFVHIEALVDRSLPADWTIRPHSHPDLNHVILIAEGGGVLHADGEEIAFEAPCLLVVPARVVHGFQWHVDSIGSVITLSNAYQDELVRRDPAIAALCRGPAAASLGREVERTVAAQVRVLQRELGCTAPGHRTAIDAALATILVHALRSLTNRAPGQESRGRQAELVDRFRAMVEDRFRAHDPVSSYAAQLGVSQTTLRVACARVAGKSPAEVINLRVVLEAKRALCYSNKSVTEIAYGLGFVDPAYFTRAFTRHAGLSPRKYRREHATVT